MKIYDKWPPKGCDNFKTEPGHGMVRDALKKGKKNGSK